MIRFATGLASPGQLPGLVCCLMVIGVLAVVETALAGSDLKHFFSWACAVAFGVGLIGIASPILRPSFWRRDSHNPARSC